MTNTEQETLTDQEREEWEELMNKSPEDLTDAEKTTKIKLSVRRRYDAPEWSLAFELASPDGRRADAIAVNTFPSRNFEVVGFEFKASRSDCETVVTLSKGDPSTDWFQTYLTDADLVCFPSDRITFIGEDNSAALRYGGVEEISDDEIPHTEDESWAWLDRWSGNFMQDESYPAIWDEMDTERYKPIIVWWGEDSHV